jgi:hypothetical protein
MIWPALSAFVIDQSPVGRRGETMSFLSGVEMLGFAILAVTIIGLILFIRTFLVGNYGRTFFERSCSED